MNNPYSYLFLNDGATRDQIEEAYARLRSKYAEDRFKDGDEGRQGALNLTNLDNAYAEIIRKFDSSTMYNGYSSALEEANACIKAGNLDRGQELLNRIGERTAEWHYLQSIVYYKRGWYLDSRTQLQAAISMDPGNAKYTDALNRLEAFISNSAKMNEPGRRQNQGNQGGNPYTDNNYANNNYGSQPRQPDPAMGVANCCTTLCLLDCCCNMLRCC